MDHTEYKNSRFGVCKLENLTQKKLEDYMLKMVGFEDKPMTVFHGQAVRSAAELGIIIEPKIDPAGVDEANPGLIRWLSNCLADLVTEATTISPLP